MDDDFGDLDDEVLDAAEDIMAKAASQHTFSTANAGKNMTVSPRRPPNMPKEEEDELYGDDFGDIDLDAVELAATQSRPARTDPSPPCTFSRS